MNKYTVQLTSKAQKQLKKLPQSISARLIEAIKDLQTNTFPPAKFKHLTHHKTAEYRLRVGDYRVLYDVYDSDQTILILVVGHRKDIYR